MGLEMAGAAELANQWYYTSESGEHLDVFDLLLQGIVLAQDPFAVRSSFFFLNVRGDTAKSILGADSARRVASGAGAVEVCV